MARRGHPAIDQANRTNLTGKVTELAGYKNLAIPAEIHDHLKALVDNEQVRKLYGNQYKPGNPLKLNELASIIITNGMSKIEEETAESKLGKTA